MIAEGALQVTQHNSLLTSHTPRDGRELVELPVETILSWVLLPNHTGRRQNDLCTRLEFADQGPQSRLIVLR